MRRIYMETKLDAEVKDSTCHFDVSFGRRALPAQRRSNASLAGAHGGENVGMSNHNPDENSGRRKPKVSSATAIVGGSGGS